MAGGTANRKAGTANSWLQRERQDPQRNPAAGGWRPGCLPNMSKVILYPQIRYYQ
jgi:hypothetical protein